MPELPEIEVIKVSLSQKIIGLKIQKIQVLSSKSFQNGMGQPFDFAQGLRGRKVLKIWRKAKILGIDLSGSKTLLFHLKMSGQLIWEKSQNYSSNLKTEDKFIGGHPTEDMLGKMPNLHTRVIFSFSDPLRPRLSSTQARSEASGSHLYFNDMRRFGWVKVVDSGQVTGDSSIKTLGPEPLEKGFTWEILKQNMLRHKSMAVKVAIMDQSVVSGVGNIYSNEACFLAKIDPRTKVGDLTDKQFKALYGGIVKSLKEGIKHGGSTRAHFVDPEGHKGYFLDYAFVYGRDKHPCKVCKTEVKKITLGGRGTYLCPHCQK